MLGLNTLDVGIGMALMFLSVSLIASAIREFGETILKTRSAFLERGIREMMGESSPTSYKRAMPGIAAAYNASKQRAATHAEAVAEGTPASRPKPEQTVSAAAPAADGGAGTAESFAGTAAVYNHFLISSLYVGEYGTTPAGELPSYVPSASFARAVLDMAARAGRVAGTTKLVAQDIRDGIADLPNSRLQRAVLNALDVADDDLSKAQTALERWFDASMDRVSGWYKRRTQYWLFFIGLGCAAVMNIDAINVMQTLATDPALRQAVVVAAGRQLVAPSERSGATMGEATEKVKRAAAQMGQVNWPIGWNGLQPAPQYRALAAGSDMTMFALKVALGWLITAFGVTFGAAFWFDVLNKFMVIRSTVKPDEKSPKEPAKS